MCKNSSSSYCVGHWCWQSWQHGLTVLGSFCSACSVRARSACSMEFPVFCSRENRTGRSRAVSDAAQGGCILLLASLHFLCLSKAHYAVSMGGQWDKTIVWALIHLILDSSMACVPEMSWFPDHPELGWLKAALVPLFHSWSCFLVAVRTQQFLCHSTFDFLCSSLHFTESHPLHFASIVFNKRHPSFLRGQQAANKYCRYSRALLFLSPLITQWSPSCQIPSSHLHAMNYMEHSLTPQCSWASLCFLHLWPSPVRASNPGAPKRKVPCYDEGSL